MRVPCVTRTMTTTRVELVCLDVVTGKTEPVFMTFPREPTDEYILGKAKLAYDSDVYKVVYIGDKIVSTAKYTMSESDFIEKAKRIEE